MPTYTIAGKKIRTDQELTDDQIDEIAQQEGYTSSVPEYAKFAVEQTKQALGGAILGVGADVGKLTSYAFPGDREQRLKDIEAAAVKKGVELDAPITTTAGKTGRLLGETAYGTGATIGAGKLLASIGLPNVGLAVARGGAGPMKDYGKNIFSQLAGKAGAGAAAGAIGATAVDPEAATEGAITGAMFGTLSSPVRWLGEKIGGGLDWLFDAASQNLPRRRAAEIVREATSPDTRAALRAAGVDQSYADVVAGRMDPTAQALAEEAARLNPQGFRQRQLDVLRREESMLDTLSGGDTQTKAAQAAKDLKSDLNDATEKMRRKSLHRVNQAGRQTTYWERELNDSMEQANITQNQLAALGSGGPVSPGMPGRAQLQNELAVRNARVARAQSRLQGLKNAGMNPLDVGTLTNYLDKVSATPGPRADVLQTKVVNTLSSRIKQLADLNGGIIDAEDLYQIRKTGINDVISELLPAGGDPIANRRVTAELIGPAKKLIDDAIEAAGGREWKRYLEAYTRGSHKIDQQEFAAFLRGLYNQDDKTRFVKIVRGDEPETVEKFFGFGRFNIDEEMGVHPQYGGANMMPTLRQIQQRLERESVSSTPSRTMLTTTEGAKAGRPELQRIIEQHRDAFDVFRQLVASKAKLGAVNELVGALDNVNPEARKIIGQALLRARSAEDLMNEMPPETMKKLLLGTEAILRRTSQSAIPGSVERRSRED